MLVLTYIARDTVSGHEINIGQVRTSEASFKIIRIPRIGETVEFSQLHDVVHNEYKIRESGARGVVVDILYINSNGIELDVYTYQSTVVYIDFRHERVRTHNKPTMENCA